MKENLALGVAVGALMLSGWAAYRPDGSASPPASELPARVLSDDDAAALRCDGTAPVEELGDVMEARINPSMTRLSFSLFHDRREVVERLDTVRAEAGRLVRCLELAATFHPEVRFDRTSRYYALLGQSAEDASSVGLAAAELDEAAAEHWFLHLKHGCARCHAEFRSTDDVVR